MLALAVLSGLDLPALTDVGALADFLELDDASLQWLADCDGRERRRRPTAQHYHYTRKPKADGGVRLVEAPKHDRLRAILCNCARFGPGTQTELPLPEFAAQLRGRIEWCGVNPTRAVKLRRAFDRIDWSG